MASSNSRNGSHDQSLPTPRFVHTDVLSAYSTGCSPSTPDAYIRALARQYPINSASDNQPRPAIAIADYGLHSAVKTAMACDREGVDYLVALRVRVVAQRAYRTWGEKTGELILLAMDETGWLSLVGLTNRGFLGGADRGRPRVDWRDLEEYGDGVIALTGMPGGGGILSAAIEHSANPGIRTGCTWSSPSMGTRQKSWSIADWWRSLNDWSYLWLRPAASDLLVRKTPSPTSFSRRSGAGRALRECLATTDAMATTCRRSPSSLLARRPT